jgi:DNA-binding LacI/PurR family transcriptional regulator
MNDSPVSNSTKDPDRLGFVSAHDVARLAGVSRSAVSRAFTPGASVAETTRDKILRAAEELGYQVNDLARGLLVNRSRLVGLVVARPEVGFRALLAAAIARALIRRGSLPLLIDTGRTDAEMLAAQKTLVGHRAEATIILTGTPPSSFVELARRNGQPVVVLGRSEAEADHVHTDNASAAAMAASLFVARGLRHVGLAGSETGTPNIVERERAFSAEAVRLGAEVTIARGPDSDYPGGLAAARQLLDRSDRPQAVFCVNDPIAFAVMDHARHVRGLAVPEDVAVIGFDDVPEADWHAYRLTTFRQDPDAMARCAVALLDRRQCQPALPPAREDLAAPLVVRHSFIPGFPPNTPS